MNVCKDTSKIKKFILVIVFLILFSVCCPKPVHAILEMEDVIAAPCKIIYMIERGILEFLNNIFCDESHQEENTIYVSPESIIKGKFVLMDPNIFRDVDTSGKEYYDAGAMESGEFGSSIISGRQELRNIVAGWYYALRNLAIVALLSVLVYVGIRMVISSASQDKAKYKMMLKDWFIALCLLFSMHYIMLATLNISSMITDAIGSSGQQTNFTERTMVIIENVTGNEADRDNYTWIDEDGEVGTAGVEYDIADGYAQCLMLFAVIIFTIIFAVKYLIRMITIVFLILLAPITCVTYPIDKISDGKAQAYNRWFQEFLYNVIIQPFHLLIYIVLVGSAITLANTNILYGILCFAVMLPAEKLIKEMFGFKDKLGSPLGALATGAIGGQLFNKIASSASKKAGGGKGADNPNTSKELTPPTKEIPLPGANGEGTDNPNSEQNNRQEQEQQNNQNQTENLEEGSNNAGQIEDGTEENLEDSPASNQEEVTDEATDNLDEGTEQEETETAEQNQNNNSTNTNNTENKPSRWTRVRAAAGRAHSARVTDTASRRLSKYGNTKVGRRN